MDSLMMYMPQETGELFCEPLDYIFVSPQWQVRNIRQDKILVAERNLMTLGRAADSFVLFYGYIHTGLGRGPVTI